MIDEQKFQHAFAHSAPRRVRCKFPCPAKSAGAGDRRARNSAIFGVPSGFITGLRSGPIAGVPNSTRHMRQLPRRQVSDDSNNAARFPACAHAWIMLVASGIGLPDASIWTFSISTRFQRQRSPSTCSVAAGADFTLLAAPGHGFECSILPIQFARACIPAALAAATGFCCARDKFILELRDETLHRPGAGFAEGADRAAAGNVVGDLFEIIASARAPSPCEQAMQRSCSSKANLRGRACIGRSFRARKIR